MKYSTKIILLIMIILFLILDISLFITFSKNRNIALDDVKLKEELTKNNTFAMMIEQRDGTYTASESNTWPTDMKYNSEKSGCIDNYGNTLENALTYDSSTNLVTVNTKGTTYCYIYFDIKYKLSELCTLGDNLGSCLTTNNSEIDSLDDTAYSEMYRYTGKKDIVIDNYICFGTSDKDTCINNPETYMYRMIGVTTDENLTLGLTTNQVKLIKHTSIGTYNWHTDFVTDTKWESSAMYTYLQGTSVLGNTSIIPLGWSDKIDSVKWYIGDVQSHTNASTIVDLEKGSITSDTSKLGLMYLSDYYYANTVGGTNNCYVACKNWMTLESNEWTMAYYGAGKINTDYHAWYVDSGGESKLYTLTSSYLVRPVFYLNADEVYMSGDGTLDNPIILSEPEMPLAGETILASSPSGLNTTMEGGLYRFQGTNDTVNNYLCFGYSDYEADCDFTNTTNSDLYAYRIIGINESGQLKLIKKEALNTAYAWNSSTGVTWAESELYTNLNGSTFYTNTTYVPTSWQSKIAETSWKYGDITTSNTTADSVYTTESGWSSTVSNYIGLMYMQDYYYAYQSGGLNCSSSGSYSTCKTAWLLLNNNDLGAPSVHEWTMSRYGSSNAWFVNSNGKAVDYPMTNTRSVRPVFYLTSDVQFISGTGQTNDPFIVE